MDGLINFTGSLNGEIEEGGGSGVTPHVTATASVNDQTGVPGVTVVRTGSDAAPNFDFNFVNLKGETGAQGIQGIQGLPGSQGIPGERGPRGFTGQTGATGPAGSDGYSPIVAISTLTDPDGHRITITDEQHPLGQSFDVMDGIDGSDGSQGPQGPQGNPGAGVAVGGTVGQILKKAGAGDYLTEWSDPTPDALPVISDEYDEHTAYSVGDYCIYENTLYKCNTNISPYEVWDSTHWDACTVGEELTEVNSSLAQLLKVESYTHNYTANANSNAHWNPVSDDDIMIAGYTAVGIISYGTNSANVVPAIVKPISDSWAITLVNVSNTNISNTFSYSVLYIKTGMYS